MEDQQRIPELMRTIDSLKQENIKMRNVIAQRNAEVNKLRQLLGQVQRATAEKQRIDEAMVRFAQRENSFK